MSWELKYDPGVKDYLEGLDEHILSRIEKSAKRLKESPRLGKQLKSFPSTTRSYRFGTPGGEFRIIYELMSSVYLPKRNLLRKIRISFNLKAQSNALTPDK